jgi:hypothetical protein
LSKFQRVPYKKAFSFGGILKGASRNSCISREMMVLLNSRCVRPQSLQIDREGDTINMVCVL